MARFAAIIVGQGLMTVTRFMWIDIAGVQISAPSVVVVMKLTVGRVGSVADYFATVADSQRAAIDALRPTTAGPEGSQSPPAC